MDWFSGLWLVALAVALLTGRAYFRGVVHRELQPGNYWSICCCYAVLAALMPVLRLFKG